MELETFEVLVFRKSITREFPSIDDISMAPSLGNECFQEAGLMITSEVLLVQDY
jgi:hypothetical protein